jgi:hypothetical protein
MNGLFRLSPTFVAAISVAAVSVSAMAWTTSPAAAVEPSQAVTATKSTAVKRHVVWNGSRRTLFRSAPMIDGRGLGHRDAACSGIWCGRQFVLIIGIGY